MRQERQPGIQVYYPGCPSCIHLSKLFIHRFPALVCKNMNIPQLMIAKKLNTPKMGVIVDPPFRYC